MEPLTGIDFCLWLIAADWPIANFVCIGFPYRTCARGRLAANRETRGLDSARPTSIVLKLEPVALLRNFPVNSRIAQIPGMGARHARRAIRKNALCFRPATNRPEPVCESNCRNPVYRPYRRAGCASSLAVPAKSAYSHDYA